MSSAKFASMTASLLARKGDAAPSLATLPPRPSAFANGHPPPPMPSAQRPVDTRPRPAPAAPQARAYRSAEQPSAPSVPARAENTDKPRRIMVIVTADEFEKLGIAAVKKDKSRHEIVRAALDAYFHQLASELPRKCACIEDGPCCS